MAGANQVDVSFSIHHFDRVLKAKHKVTGYKYGFSIHHFDRVLKE